MKEDFWALLRCTGCRFWSSVGGRSGAAITQARAGRPGVPLESKLDAFRGPGWLAGWLAD